MLLLLDHETDAATLRAALDDGGVGVAVALPRDADGTVDWGRAAMVHRGPEGPEVGRLPPFDVSQPSAMAGLLPVAGADVAVQYTLTGAPGGDLDHHQVFVAGQVADVGPGWRADADVYVELRYRRYLELRAGLVDMRGALVDGDLQGDYAKLSILLGILEGPELAVAWDQRRPAAAALLAALGDRPAWPGS